MNTGVLSLDQLETVNGGEKVSSSLHRPRNGHPAPFGTITGTLDRPALSDARF